MSAKPRKSTVTPLRHVSLAERRARLGRRHRLAPNTSADAVESIVHSLVALHATDPATVYLSAAARLREPNREHVEHALFVERSVIRHHAMRRTVWVMEPSTARAAHAACTVALAAKEWKTMQKMLADNGVADPEAWLATAKVRAQEVIAGFDVFTARQLGAAAPDLALPLRLSVGKTYEGTQGAHTRLVQNLGFEGELVRTRPVGTWVSGEYAWSATKAWLPGGFVDHQISAREGSATLADRYVRAFGPVTTQDLQWWAGWTGGQTAQALADISAVAVTIDGELAAVPAWLHPEDTDIEPDVDPWATLLPSLDPTVMGWKDRTWYVGIHGAFGKTLFDRNGNAGNSVWANGKVIGTYAHQKDRSVVVHFFDAPTKKVRGMVESSVERYLSTVGDTVVRPRYPAPVQATLTAN